MSYLNHTDYDTAKAPGAAKHGEPAITYDVETGQQKVVVVPAEGYANFANKLVRQGFIRKVFGIIFVQVLITFGLTAIFVFSSSAQEYIYRHSWTYGLSLALFFSTYIALVCCGNVRRQYPMNYILLTVFTLSTAFMVATVSASYTAKSVVLCLGMLAIIVAGLTLFACQTRYDFTTAGGMLGSLLLALIIFGFVQIFWRDPFVQTVYAALGAFLFSAYLVYDIQLVMGGKRVEISTDEYIIAALMIYLDIINLFLFLLQLFGDRRD